ncbi:unnamed protein product [Ophioblennius macclurei]
MVIFLEWHRTSLDPKRRSSLPMDSEGSGLEALASPLAGYLEKVQTRAASLEHCPWCTAKGLTYALRSYQVNLQESITLCTNPQCLFPLVTRSLEDILASLDPVEPTVGTKRKTTLEEEEMIKPATKRLRPTPQSATDAPTNTEESDAAKGQHAGPQTDCEEMNGSQKECAVTDATEQNSEVDDVDAMEDSVSVAQEDGVAVNACPISFVHSSEVLQTNDEVKAAASSHRDAVALSRSDSSSPDVLETCNNLSASQSVITNEDMNSASSLPPLNQHEKVTAGAEEKSEIAEIITCQEMESEGEDLSRVPLTKSEELVSVPSQLFWKNSDKLCWLDSLLVALVNCKSLRNCKPPDEPQQSPVWRLIKGYEDVCVAVQAHHQTDSDGVVRVPRRFLQKANKDLQSLRMSVFEALEPKLHCKLGQRETPVFAMPLLLSMDSWAERLFQSAFQWEFKCGSCRAATEERVSKTISTCTNLMPDWSPLHAVHRAPCNVCRSRNQKRTMKLVGVPPVFALHFVKGLPNGDVSTYSFDFKGKHYDVTTVIQYDQRLKHFVTWIRRSDGSWLEYDDLKHPNCKEHEELRIPAKQLHVLFWEAEERKDSTSCSPSSTFVESSPSGGQKVTATNGGDLGEDDPADYAAHNDTDIVHALSASDATFTTEKDTSIGANTLLDAFEGLNHSDIITLTLVDLNAESEAKSLPEAESQSEAISITSSSVANGEKHPNADVQDLTCPTLSDAESQDSSSSDPTYTPISLRGRTRAATRSRRMAAKSKTAPAPAAAAASSRASSKARVSVEAPPPKNKTPRVEISQQESPVVPVGPPSTPQTPAQPKLNSNGQFSLLLGQHPLSQVQKPTAKPAIPIAQQKPVPPCHSTPSTVKRPQTPVTPLHRKVPLRVEESKTFPPKAAEMYGAFGAKWSNSYVVSNPPHPLTPNHFNATAKSMPSRQTHDVSLKKRSSDLPPGLSSTDALRLKLLKKLKAKKKKLAKLNMLLGLQGEGSHQPDSTDRGSPSTVTSSTYDGSSYDDFLSDLLSPATTASNLSPDSTEFLESLANGKDGTEQTFCATPVPSTDNGMNTPNPENFLEEFLSKAATQTPTDMETEALGALELFVQ